MSILMIKPTLQEFLNAERPTPVIMTVPLGEADPLELFRRMARSNPIAFLLESGKGPLQVSRYSFMGCDPYLLFSGKDNHYVIRTRETVHHREGSPFEALSRLLRQSRIPNPGDLPPFIGGAVGFFSYDLVRQFESLPQQTKDDLGVPDLQFAFVDLVAAADRLTEELILIFSPPLERHRAEPREKLYQEGRDRLDELQARLSATMESHPDLDRDFSCSVLPGFHQEIYAEKVRQCQEFIRSGDIYQANLSHRFTLDFSGMAKPECATDRLHATLTPRLFERLRTINPSPFSGILQFEEFSIVSSSPERLVRLSNHQVETRPIAGTRPRGHTPSEDRRLVDDLLRNEKERAEHLMLVDLARNDLGRVCEYGSVKADEFMIIERYSHVSHIVSNIRGSLRPGLDGFDLIRAMFPGGTITGVPKIHCMEILESLEPYRRGPYTGSMGYLSWSGDLDLSIIIRSVLLTRDRGYLHVGAGIVADSDPEREYEETVLKAQGILQALQRDSPTGMRGP